ncbi:MAG: low molecular weight phosphotyrosine protein phosphatase [Erysipelotrichaceae bacterium]|nr:low molecular weight phosphotyrosine protein phosphatase [Erysipelotrichaceae bacterium]
MISILMVCHGNICRSTMAQCIMQHLVNEKGLGNMFHIDSAATSREEIGNGIHHGTVRTLKEHNIPVLEHYAKQITKNDYQKFDYILGMDSWNMMNLERILGNDPAHKVKRLLDYSTKPRDIADPWYTGNFEVTYQDVLEGCNALLQHILEQ